MNNIEGALYKWLKENGIECGICFDNDFAYDLINNIIYVGTTSNEKIIHWFEQFIYEYGAEYIGINPYALMMLHEVGHYFTIHSFEAEECFSYYVAKLFLCSGDQKGQFEYWEIPDEFSANMWEVNFINRNIEAVNALSSIFAKAF